MSRQACPMDRDERLSIIMTQPRSNSRFGDTILIKRNLACDSYPFIARDRLIFIKVKKSAWLLTPGYQELVQYNDVETHNNYQIMRERPHEKAMDIIQAKSRDNRPYAYAMGRDCSCRLFTKATWLEVASNYPTINVEKELAEGKFMPIIKNLFACVRNICDFRWGLTVVYSDHPIMACKRAWGSTITSSRTFLWWKCRNWIHLLPWSYSDKVDWHAVQYAEGLT